MTILGRSIVRITGFVGEPGFNIIHWSAGVGPGPTDPGGVEEWHDTLQSSFTALADLYNNQQTITIEPDVAYFDASDGVLTGVTTDPAGARVIDCTSVSFVAPRSLCAVMRLRTEEFVNGRRLQGRIFLGPTAQTLLDGAGQVPAFVQEIFTDAFAGTITGLGGRLAVWHRPTAAAPTSGSYGDVTTLAVNGTPGSLRSRKT